MCIISLVCYSFSKFAEILVSLIYLHLQSINRTEILRKNIESNGYNFMTDLYSNKLIFRFQSQLQIVVWIKLNEIALTFYTYFISVIGHMQKFLIVVFLFVKDCADDEFIQTTGAVMHNYLPHNFNCSSKALNYLFKCNQLVIPYREIILSATAREYE